MSQPFQRGNKWWTQLQDGSWAEWNEQNSEWQAQAMPPPPPPAPVQRAPEFTRADVVPPQPRPAAQTLASPVKTNGFAVASLIFGIIGGFLLAIIFGGVALSQIDKSGGREGGRTMALWGLWLGIAWLVLIIIAVSSSGNSY
jgi:hypothetical protein